MNDGPLFKGMATAAAAGFGLAIGQALVQQYATPATVTEERPFRVAVHVPERHQAGGKSWRKVVTGVDPGQHTGYAFLSDQPNEGFVPHGRTVMVPVGTILMAYDDENGKPWVRAVKVGETGLPIDKDNNVQYVVSSRDVKWADAIKDKVSAALGQAPLYHYVAPAPEPPASPPDPKGFEGLKFGAPNEELVRKVADMLWDLSNHGVACPDPKDCRTHFRAFQTKAEDLMIQWVDYLGSLP